MKTFLLAAAAISVLSTAAFASNDGSLPYDHATNSLQPIHEIAAPRVLKKKVYSSNSSTTVVSDSVTGYVSDVERVSEKNGDSHDQSQ